MQQSNSLDQRQTQRRGVFIGFASLIFMYWAAMGPMGYNTLLLQSGGFSSAEVGSILAAYAAVGIVAPPIWGYIADRIGSASKTFILIIGIQAVVVASLPLFGGIKVGGFVLLAAAMPLSNFVRTCSQNLLDAWTMQNTTRTGISFGSVRLFGSLGWTVSCVGMSILASVTNASIAFYLGGIISVIVCAMALRLNRKYPSQHTTDIVEKVVKTAKKINPFRLFKNYYFVVLLVYVLLSQMMFNCTAFLPYLLEHLNIDANFTGTLMGLRSLTEVPFLLMGGLLLRRFPLPKLLAGVSILLTIEQLCYNFVSTPIAIVLIVLIGGLGSGLYFSTTIEYAFRLAPPELASSAQTFLGMATAMGMVCSSLLGGFMVDTFGVLSFYTTAGIIIFGGFIFFVLSFPFATKVLKKPIPEDLLRKG